LDRCALFVDANYALAEGAFSVHGTRNRDSVSWDYSGLLKLFGSLSRDRTGLPLLRCYWYDTAAEGSRGAEHETLADIPGVKLRVCNARPSRKDGAEAEIRKDLTALARNHAVSDMIIVSAEEDLGPVIAEVQDLGVRAILLHVSDEDLSVSRALRQECDDIIEISAGHLRPYVDLIAGAEPQDAAGGYRELAPAGTHVGSQQQPPETLSQQFFTPQLAAEYEAALQPQVAGLGASAAELREALHAQEAARFDNVARGTAEAAPVQIQGRAEAPGQPYMQLDPSRGQIPANLEPMPSAYVQNGYEPDPSHLQNGRAHNGASYGGVANSGPGQVGLSQSAAQPGQPMNGAGPHTARGGQLHGDGQATPLPGAMQAGVAGHPVQPAGGHPLTGGGHHAAGHHAAGQQANGHHAAGQQTNGHHAMAPDSDRGYPGPSSAGVAGRLPQGGVVPSDMPPGTITHGAQPNGGLPATGMASAASSNGMPPGGIQQPAGAHHASDLPASHGLLPPAQPGQSQGAVHGQQPISRQPASPGFPPGNPQQNGPSALDPQRPLPQRQLPAGGMPYASERGGQYGGQPQHQYGGQPGAYPPATYGGQQSSALVPAPQVAISVGDAVQSAHAEGFDFGEAVARDAPALWLEAVLARKPRMPSDLEARLLQGSALPIDSLLHDEVRHALRRGFWDALERSRH
jgi:hypothetical protein